MGSSDDEMARLWKETKLIVEANSYERMTLWERWTDKTEWQQHLQGRLVTVGTYHRRVVCVTLVWATIRGKAVLFLEATSELVDWKKIDAWLKREFPGVRKIDAMNFGPGCMELASTRQQRNSDEDRGTAQSRRLAAQRGLGDVVSTEICQPNPDLLKIFNNETW
jgi:hypothetical protein